MTADPSPKSSASKGRIIRILIAEDSAVQAELLAAILEDAGGFDVVGTASDGLKAVAMTAELRPDIVLMDFHMPWLDGLEATRRIMAETPVPVVIASASFRAPDVAVVFETVKCGALAVIGKPPAPGNPDHDRSCAELVRTLRLMADVAVVRRWAQVPRVPAAPVVPVESVGKASRLVAIGGSTGAPKSLVDILAALPKDLAAPVLVVQHLARGFAPGFAAWLQECTKLKAKVAVAGEATVPGVIYVGPEDAHLGIGRDLRIILSDAPPDGGFRPSVNHLFRSVAAACGSSALGVILSGMGSDGAAGLLELRQAGGVTAAQNEKSCVIFGMPNEAIRLGAVKHIDAPAGIADLIAVSVGTASRGSHVRA